MIPRYIPKTYIQRYESDCPLYAEHLLDAASHLRKHLAVTDLIMLMSETKELLRARNDFIDLGISFPKCWTTRMGG